MNFGTNPEESFEPKKSDFDTSLWKTKETKFLNNAEFKTQIIPGVAIRTFVNVPKAR